MRKRTKKKNTQNKHKTNKSTNAIPNNKSHIHNSSETSENINRTDNNTKSITHSLSEIVEMVVAILTLLGVVVSFITIGEMRAERELAYKPNVVINPTEIEFSWDSDGFESWVEEATVTAEDDEVTVRSKVSIMYDGRFARFPIANIGVGAAQNICITWHETNTSKLIDHLISLDESKKDFCYVDKSIVFSYGTHIVATDKEVPSAFMYLLPNASDKSDFGVPAHYSLLINEIMKTGKYKNELFLILNVEYDDIQGMHYNDIVAVRIKRVFMMQNEDGSGTIRYQLIPQVIDKHVQRSGCHNLVLL